MNGIIKALKQRIYYIKNFKKGFSFVFLLPGFLREKFGENLFFTTLVKNIKSINIAKSGDRTIIKSGKYNFIFPHGCFYEGDFFDIVYPNLQIQDPRIESLVYENPFYESEGNYENFGAKMKKGDYVIDAGANIGMFSIIASDKVGEDGKIFAFEPLPEVSAVLRENIDANGCNNIYIEEKILGNVNKKVDFYYNLEENYNASSTINKGGSDKVVKLQQITLDQYIKDNNITRLDFIKADIEGAERDLISGAEEVIKKFKPKISIRTYHLPDDPEVLFGMIKKYVPEYNIVLDKKTLYAWI
ncbi:MAG: FkbM family methyltransferase [bacterium]